jgi:hypothetical protein
VCQLLITKGERSGLPTLIAATEGHFVVRADETLTAFAELASAIRLYRRNPRNLPFNDISVSAEK